MTALYAIGGLTVFACFSVWLAVRLAGQGAVADERRQATKDALDEVKQANDARADVGALSADARRRELQRWARD